MLGVFIFIDQFTKLWAVKHLQGQQAIPIIKDVFELHYLEGGNTGAAWGLLSGRINFFIITTIILMLIIIYLFFRINRNLHRYEERTKRFIVLTRLVQFVIILILSGAAGNLIDRIRLNYVIDFLYFKLINFPIFNIADSYVTIAVIFMIILMFIIKDEEFSIMFGTKKKETGVSDGK